MISIFNSTGPLRSERRIRNFFFDVYREAVKKTQTNLNQNANQTQNKKHRHSLPVRMRHA